jgi:hypothetical protein
MSEQFMIVKIKKVANCLIRRTLSALVLFTLTNGERAQGADCVRIIDDGEPGFTVGNPSLWYGTSNQGCKADFLSSVGLLAGEARWAFSVNPGAYRISMSWHNPGSPYNILNSTAAPISVKAGSNTLISTTVNFRTTPSDRTDAGVNWKDLGVVNVTSNPLEVRLSAIASLYVLADAVRIERIDGTPITSPTVTSTVPMNSPLSGGIPVTIYGTQFSSGTRVLFGGKESPQVTFISPTELKAIAPTNTAGTVNISIVTPDGLSGELPGKFKYAIGRTLDDGEPGFAATAPAGASWTAAAFQGDYASPGGPARDGTASWQIAVNSDKAQALAVTWYNPGSPYNVFYSPDARFDVIDGTTVLATISANLQTTPSDFTDLSVRWKRLGEFVFTSGMAKVVLRNNTDKWLTADAIRVQEVASSLTPPAPVVTVAATDSSAGESGSGLGNGAFTFTRSGNTAASLTANFSVSGTAATGVDYAALGTSVTFAAGSATAVKTVSVIEDSLVEPNETVVVSLTDGGASYTIGTPASATATINDDDELPTITIAATDGTAGEAGTGLGNGLFTFTRSGSTAAGLMVNFAVSGTASSGIDYTALGTSVTFAPGSATAVKTLGVIEDVLSEPNETVVVTLTTGGITYNIGSPGAAAITIQNDDAEGLPVVTVLATDSAAGEPNTIYGTGTFTFSRSGSTTAELTVNFIVSGTAVSGVDYVDLGTTVTFAAGATTATKTVNVIDDTIVQSTSRTVVARVVSGASYTVGTAYRAGISIKNDDKL